MKQKPNTNLIGRFFTALSAGLLLAAGITDTGAAVRTWTGGGDPDFNWSNAANWGGTALAADDDIVFTGSIGLLTTNDLAVNTSFNSVTFDAAAGAFTLEGNQMRIGKNNGNKGYTNASPNIQNIHIETKNDRQVNYDTTGASMVFTKGPWDQRFSKSGPNDLICLQQINQLNGQVTGITGGRLIMAGQTNGVAGHGLQIDSNGTAVSAGPANQIGDSDTRADVTMSGSGLFQVQNTNAAGAPYFEQIPMLRSSSLAAVVENGSALGPVQLRIGGGTGARVGAYDGTLRDGSGGGALSVMLDNFSGACYWRLGGTNTYTGETVVTNNTSTGYTRLIVNGKNLGGGDYTVGGGVAGSWGVLSGAGTIVAGNVNINANGAISPGGTLSGTALYTRQGGGGSGSGGINTGIFAESTASLTITNNVNLVDATSTLIINLNGTSAGSFDQLVVAGSGVFSNNSANLQLTTEIGYLPNAGDQYTIVDVPGTNAANNVGIFGSLNGVPTYLGQGATFLVGATTVKISYRAEGTAFDMGAGKGNNIMIEVLPDTARKLAWRGDVDGDWDVNGKLNWRDTNNVASTFTNMDKVTFNDTGLTTNVNLTTDINPVTVQVDATNDYFFSTTGLGKLTGVVVMTKTNTGKLVITTDNDFAGSTTIQGGTVQVGDNGYVGTLPGSVILYTNGILEHKRADSQNLGSVTGPGQLVHSGSGPLVIANNLTAFTGSISNLAGAGTLQLGDGSSNNGSVPGRIDLAEGTSLLYSYYDNNVTIANSLSGTGGTVQYQLATGQRTYTLPKTTVNASFTGTNIVGPYVSLYAQDGNSGYIFGNGGTVIVENYGQVYMDRSGSVPYNQNFILRSTSFGNQGSAATGGNLGGMRMYQCTVSGSVTLETDQVFGGNTDGATIAGPIIGNSYQIEIRQSTPTTLVLSLSNNANAWGNTLITSGGLRSLASGSISTNAMTIDATGFLDVYGTIVAVNSLNNGVSGAGVVFNKSPSAAGTIVIGADDSTVQFDGMFGDGASKALNVTKVGAGTLTLTAVSTNTGTVAVDGGTLALNTSGSFGNAKNLAVGTSGILDVVGRTDGTLTLNANQTLKHSGASVGPITVNGNLNMGSGTLLLALNTTNTPATNDSLVVTTGTLTAGGTLTVTNVGPALQAGQSFQLFSAGVSGFAYNLQTNDVANNVKYSWNNEVETLGKITLLSVSTLVNTTPTNITATVNGGNLTLEWPADHTGWTLQTQTNNLNVGLSGNWANVAGSTTTNKAVIPIDPVNGSVFFRMVYTNTP